MAKYPNVSAANRYARDVVSGRIDACLYVRQACQRHIDDLAVSNTALYPYRLNKDKAERACKFMQLLPHTKGKWAKKPLKDRRIKLEPWQLFIHVCIYGWERKKDKTRRFRQVYIEVPRKNGKSIIAAGNSLYTLCADGEYGAEVYCGATTEKQAWEVFKPALKMVEALPGLRSRFKLQQHAKKITKPDGAVFEPVIGKPGDGSSPHLAVVDEYHEHDNDDLFSTMQTGMGSREQPLVLVITTAGENLAGPCKQMHDDVIGILAGAEKDDEIFGIIYTVDQGDDWSDPKALAKANPNLGVSIELDYLIAQQQRAARNPSKQNTFKTKHLNLWVSAASAFFNMEDWKKAEDPSLRIEDFTRDPCYSSLDLASKIDICSNVLTFEKRDADNRLHYYVFSRHYLPEDTIHDPDQKNSDAYMRWVSTPWENSAGTALNEADGAEIDFNNIYEELCDQNDWLSIKEVPYDPYNATQLAHMLSDAGMTPVKIPQTTAHLSPGMREIEAALKSGRLHHDGNPVLTWMISNVVAKVDAKNNVFPRKNHVAQKIDGAVCLIMGVYRAMTANDGPSIYEDDQAMLFL